MKRIIKFGVAAAIVALNLTGCVTLSEEESEKRLKRPQYDVTIPDNPQWDTPEGEDENIGK